MILVPPVLGICGKSNRIGPEGFEGQGYLPYEVPLNRSPHPHGAGPLSLNLTSSAPRMATWCKTRKTTKTIVCMEEDGRPSNLQRCTPGNRGYSPPMMYDCNDDDGVLRLVGCVRVVSVSHLPTYLPILLINVLTTL